MSTEDRILLIGMMGAGKTTTGRLLAHRLGWRYLDSDEEVQRRTGRTVPELWHERGEAAFRAEESAVLVEALAGDGPVVVSVAGGAVLDRRNRQRLRDGGTVVWLRADPELLSRRVGNGDGRPLLESDPRSALQRLDEERRPLYDELADITVDVDGLAPGQVVDAIEAARR